jgi:hypothetical protein
MENGKANSGSNPKGRPRVVVVGSGFAGFTCAREQTGRRGRPRQVGARCPFQGPLRGGARPARRSIGGNYQADRRVILTLL